MTATVVYDKPQGPPPDGMKWAITEIYIQGPGFMKHFAINAKLVYKSVTWRESCTIAAGTGLVCDGRVRKMIPKTSTWSAAEMDVFMAVAVQKWSLVPNE